VKWESGKPYPAIASAVFCSVAAAFTAPGNAAEYDAVSLLAMPPPAYDLSQGRPALGLHRPEIGAINSAGDLAGAGDAGSGQLDEDTRPFFFSRGAQTTANLGDLTGDFADQAVAPGNGASRGRDINDAGWVVGVSSTTPGTGNTDDRPFLWFDDDANDANTPGEMRGLALNPGATFGSAIRVNNAGQVLITGDTGLYRGGFSLNAGVLSENGGRSLIAPVADAADMNDAGDVAYLLGNAGYVWRDLNADNSADPNETTRVPFMSANPLWQASMVFGINNAGQVVGTMRNDQGRDIGFLWTDLNADNVFDWSDTNNNGVFEANETSNEVVRFHGDPAGIDAAIGSTFAKALNDDGTVVGGFILGSQRRAFIYDVTNGMRYLDDLVDTLFPVLLRQADAINGAGLIAAFGRTPGDSFDQLVLLTAASTALAGDLDGDGFVGIADLNLVLGNWNQSVPPGDPLADPSGDGFVGIEDLNAVLGKWNTGTPPPAQAPGTVPEPGIAVWLGAGLAILRRRPGARKPVARPGFSLPTDTSAGTLETVRARKRPRIAGVG
jgi:probable HAF family extracellular repeat protein